MYQFVMARNSADSFRRRNLSGSRCSRCRSSDILRQSPEARYQRGYEDYQRGRYEKAIESFQRLKEEYPLSELAIRGELGIGDANFSMQEYGYAELAYSDFVNLHPANENLPYVMYQIGSGLFNKS